MLTLAKVYKKASGRSDATLRGALTSRQTALPRSCCGSSTRRVRTGRCRTSATDAWSSAGVAQNSTIDDQLQLHDWVDASVGPWMRAELALQERAWGPASTRAALAFVHIPPCVAPRRPPVLIDRQTHRGGLAADAEQHDGARAQRSDRPPAADRG